MTPSRRRVMALLAACLLSGGRTGTVPTRVLAGPAHSVPSGVFVGRVADTDAFVAVVMKERDVVAYVCDGSEAGVSLWGWFAGELVDDHTTLVSTTGMALLLDGSGATPTGAVIPTHSKGGTPLAFTTEPATGNAGLWRAQGIVDDIPVLAGWVVLNDGQQRGALVARGLGFPAVLPGLGGIGLPPGGIALPAGGLGVPPGGITPPSGGIGLPILPVLP